MQCFSPITAYRTADGSVVFAELGRYDISQTLSLRCGQCVGCRLRRSREWATRVLHEASLYDENVFLTLTYDQEHVPEGNSLKYEHFQKFMKRLRKHFKGRRIRFYMCGEYGETFDRPHYHACVFNCGFSDKYFWRRTEQAAVLYRSSSLESLWPYGFSTIGDVTFDSAAYVARYVMKKINGDLAESHYSFVDSDGVMHTRCPEFNRMSLKPGIGADWLKKWQMDVYPHDYVITNKGKKVNTPKYYDKLFEVSNPEEFEQLKYERELNGRAHWADNTDERLEVKAQVAAARLSFLRRSLA